MKKWDLIIIGGGVSGLTSGIYAARSGLKTLIIEEKMAGGTPINTALIENYPGFQSINGIELAQRFKQHCLHEGARINELEKVLSLDLVGEEKIVKSSNKTYRTKAIIIASGSYYRQINVPGEKKFLGKGVSYCGICDGPLFKGKKVIIVGGGNSALTTSLYLANLATKVIIVHRRDQFRADKCFTSQLSGKQNIKVIWNNEIKEICGEEIVKKIIVYNNKTSETREINCDGIFIQVGMKPNSQIAKDAGVKVDENNYIKIDQLCHTNIEGIYAAGDVVNHPIKQIGVAVGQGITATLEAYGYIQKPYYYCKT
jgi:thioredoxin reductase (NADPH)